MFDESHVRTVFVRDQLKLIMQFLVLISNSDIYCCVIEITENKLTLTRCATGVRITFVTFDARASWLMILCGAASIEAAWTDTRILATLRLTGTIRWTILMDDTFWPTIWWCTEHTKSARAHSTIVDVTALGIWSAWAGYAWIHIAWWLWVNNGCKCIEREGRVLAKLLLYKQQRMQSTYVWVNNFRMDRR